MKAEHISNIQYAGRALGIAVRSQLQYLSSFWLQIIGSAFLFGVEFVAILLLFQRYPSVGQWTHSEVFLFYGLSHCAFTLAEIFIRGISALHVTDGSYDRMLLRPRPAMLQAACRELDLRRFGSVLIGVIALSYGISQTAILWTPGKVSSLLLAVAGGFFLVCGLFIAETALTFVTLQNTEAFNVITYGGRSAMQYPIDIYNGPLRWLFLFIIPYGLTIHFPASCILGRPLFGWPEWLSWLSPLLGIAFFLLTMAFWSIMARRYQSTGS